MNTTEIVVAEMQCDGGFQVLDLLRECIRESRESAAHHAKREILPFDEARADVFSVRIATDHLGYGLREPWWSVTLSPDWKTAINLDQHRIIDISARNVFSTAIRYGPHPSVVN